MISYRESNIDFTFPEDSKVLKLDDSNFYRQVFARLPGGKGVDFVIDSADGLVFLEVKNCIGHEAENKARTKACSDARVDAATISFKAETFDVEVSAKVAMSFACLLGAYTKAKSSSHAQELEAYAKVLLSESVRTQKKGVVVILVLEGKFDSQVRTKKMLMGRLQQSIQSKLGWLAIKRVRVVDSNTYKQRYFTMSQ